LLFQRHSKLDVLASAIYNVYKAKRNAEVSIGVGKETDMLILTKKDILEIGEVHIETLKKIYDDELCSGKTNPKLFEIVSNLLR